MELVELLEFISLLADKKGMTKPYIVGGVPRDRLLKRFNDFSDVDLTTGDESIHALAREAAARLKSPTTSYIIMPDGHAKLYVGNFKLDFSSNFKVPGIKERLEKAGIKNVDSMTEELYSRDFTCNAMLMSLDLKTVYDPMGKSVADIKKGVINTCLDPSLTLGYDNKRIARAIYFSSKLGFEIGDNVAKWIAENKEVITRIKNRYFEEKVGKAFEYDPEKTVDNIEKMGLWSYVSSMPEFFGHVKRSPERI
jgi:tRNA nucleotidyltransferase/poly(A) polymerase